MMKVYVEGSTEVRITNLWLKNESLRKKYRTLENFVTALLDCTLEDWEEDYLH